MNIADLAVIGIIVLAGLTAFSLGFVRVVLALLGWIGATAATLYGFRYVRPFTQEWISVGFLADAAAGLGIFLVSLIILTIISHAIGRRIRDSALSALDRSLGLVFGLALGGVLVSLGYLGVAWATDMPAEASKQPEWFREAKTRPLVEWGAARLQRLAPPEWAGQNGRGPSMPESTRERFEKLIEPETQPSTAPRRQGYSEQERREMDRLIRGQSQ
jgi:membrane protein required for colicin V production